MHAPLGKRAIQCLGSVCERCQQGVGLAAVAGMDSAQDAASTPLPSEVGLTQPSLSRRKGADDHEGAAEEETYASPNELIPLPHGRGVLPRWMADKFGIDKILC